MDFDELTLEQQALVREFVTQLRAGAGDLSRALRLVGGLATVFATYAPLFMALDTEQELPSNSGLAGIGPVTMADVLATMEQLQAVAVLQTPESIERMVRLAGINAMLS